MLELKIARLRHRQRQKSAKIFGTAVAKFAWPLLALSDTGEK
jgi:hypothetical protein